MTGARPIALLLALLVLAACQPSNTRRTPPAPALDPPAAGEHALATADSGPGDAAAPIWLAPEPQPARSAAEVFDRLHARMLEPACSDSPRVDFWRRHYAAHPHQLAAQIEAALPLLGLVLERLEDWRMPAEYALLPIAESGYRPDARGRGDHLGLWQFGRSTASDYALPVNRHFDARLAPQAATEAAIAYLARLHNRFGSWELATAAFNAGPQRLQRLLDQDPQTRRSPGSGMPRGLPRITFEHIARIRALACLLGPTGAAALPLQGDTPIDPLTTVRLPPGQSSLAAIAAARTIQADLLVHLNPAFRGGFISAEAPRELLVPQSVGRQLDGLDLPHAEAPPDLPALAHDEHVVRRGDTLSAIARRYGVRLAALYRINRLNERSILRPGQRIRLSH